MTCGCLVTKPLFLYATGTAFFAEIMGTHFGAVSGASMTLNPTGGRKVWWGGEVTDDPFWRCLDERKWDARKVDYPAAILPMGPSIDTGVTMTCNHLLSTPSGTPFMLGGYSQGAAVMSKVYRELKTGSLTSRWSDFKGAVMFGNPMRQQDFLAPGLTWSGAWDVPGSTTGGSGCFPDRLSGCDYGLWREYVNHNEVITATGTSANGAGWRSAVGFLTGMVDPLTNLHNLTTTTWIEGTAAALAIGADGHMAYPTSPPITYAGQTFSPGTSTSYELALAFVNSVYDGLSITGILPTSDPSMQKPWKTYIPFPAA